MNACCSFVLAGERVELLAQRALYWPAQRLLAIADLHLGKDDVFRDAGIALPAGGSNADLIRLSELLESTGAARLRVLGDFIHGTRGVARWRNDWRDFRTRHDIAVELVLGNHDRGLDTEGLEVATLGDGVLEGPFHFTHAHEGGNLDFCISGHVHPVVRLPTLGKAFPVFHLHEHGIVLPAFSAMTGGWKVPSKDPWVACIEDHVLVSPAFATATIGLR